jgi:guanine deaminase
MMSAKRTLISGIMAVRQAGAAYGWDRCDLLIVGDRITAIEPPGSIHPEASDRLVPGERLVATPGFINGHAHSWDHYLKGCIENLTMEISMSMIRQPRPVALTPRQIYLRTVIGAIESLRSGATMIVDDLSLGQVFNEAHVEAALQAYDDTGTRALVGFSMIDKPVVDSYPFTADEFPPALLAELRGLPRPGADELIGLVRRLATGGRHPKSARVGVLVSPSAPHRCTDGFMRSSAALAAELDLPKMTHCQETRIQLVTGQEFYGRSLVEHLEFLGFLGPRTTLIHATWLSQRDIGIIARSGASVQYNPWSNAILGSGIAPVRECLDAGINVSFGTDGCGLPYGVNMLNALGTGAVISKIRDPDPSRWLTAAEVFRAATEGGAIAFGLEDQIGRLAVGMKADIVCYSLDSTALTPLNDPVRQIIYSERGLGVDTVIVNGQPVMQGGRLTLVDEIALLREAQDAHAELQETLVSSQEDSSAFRDALTRVYLRSLACPIAHDHYAALVSGNNIAAADPAQ